MRRFLPANAAPASTAEYNEADMVYEAEDEKIPALPAVLTEVQTLLAGYLPSLPALFLLHDTNCPLTIGTQHTLFTGLP